MTTGKNVIESGAKMRNKILIVWILIPYLILLFIYTRTLDYLNSANLNIDVQRSELSVKNDLIMENSFKIWEQKLIIDVMSDGATLAQAHSVIEYAMMFDIDVRTFSILIASESGFKHIDHDLDYVIGICGINTKANSDLPFNNFTDSGNIGNAAYLMRGYLDATNNNYLKAITKYKGNSKAMVKVASAILEKARK